MLVIYGSLALRRKPAKLTLRLAVVGCGSGRLEDTSSFTTLLTSKALRGYEQGTTAASLCDNSGTGSYVDLS